MILKKIYKKIRKSTCIYLQLFISLFSFTKSNLPFHKGLNVSYKFQEKDSAKEALLATD